MLCLCDLFLIVFVTDCIFSLKQRHLLFLEYAFLFLDDNVDEENE